jgi:fructokinase
MADACALLVCGEALIDLVPIEAGAEPTFRAVCGGSPYNVAISLGRLGADAYFLGRLSGDANGARLARRLSENGVSLDFVSYGSAPSTLACVTPAGEGQPDVGYAFYVEATSGATLSAEDFPTSLPERIGLVHFGSFSALLPQSGRLIREFAAGSGRIVSYDPNIRPAVTPDPIAIRPEVGACVAVADIVKLSDADAVWLYPDKSLDAIAARLLRLGSSLVAITRGAEGAIIRTRSVCLSLPGVATRVVDTVGAGDTFMAAFLWDLGRRGLIARATLADSEEEDLEGAAQVACRAAAIVCGRRGAEPPFAAELHADAP